MNDCTLLLSTYDGGEDLWEGFFVALTTKWQGFDLPVVVNTETKVCTFEGLNIRTINCETSKKGDVWGRRLIHTLKNVDTEYVLLFLDDYWLDAPVDIDYFERCRRWMRENKDISYFSFQRVKDNNIKDNRFERFEKRSQKGPYRMNCQVALWRRKKLIQYLMPHENAWEWEKYGTMRSRRYNDNLYSLIDGEPLVFSYTRSGVVRRGKWIKEVVVPLQKEYNLEIDYSGRGFLEDMDIEKKRQRNVIVGIKNRINIIKSLLG